MTGEESAERDRAGNDGDRSAFESGAGPKSTIAGEVQAPLAGLQWWRGLSARVVAFLVLVLLGSVGSAWAILDQQKRLQARLEILTAIYVPFQDSFAEAFALETNLRNYLRAELEDAAASPSSDPGGTTVALMRAGRGRTSSGAGGKGARSSGEGGGERGLVDPLLRSALKQRRRSLQEAMKPLESAIAGPERFGGRSRLRGVAALLAELRRLDGALEDDRRALLAHPITKGSGREGSSPAELRSEAVSRLNRIRLAYGSVRSQAQDDVRAHNAAIREAGRRAERWTLWMTLAAGALGLVAAVAVVWTLRPLHRLIHRVRELGRGDRSQRIVVGPRPSSDNEVSRLAREFNSMVAALDEHERRLIHGERMAAVGRMAAQITHEIRNPLSSVGLNVELLEDELAPDNEEGRELLRSISEEVDRLTVITESYLSYARRPQPEFVAVELRGLVDDLLNFLAREHARGGLTVLREYAAEALWVRGDPRLLRQALLNLLRNAQEAALEVPSGDDAVRSATPPPQISVSLGCKAGEVTAIVGDSGPGIQGLRLPDEAAAVAPDAGSFERIFEPFFTGKARGTGLGLPLVAQVAAEHAGSVKVLSTGPEGTRFELRFPACDPPAASVSSDTAQWADGAL